MASASCSLLRLEPGSTGSIHKIAGMNPILRRRLADLGVSEGVTIRLKGKGPLLGPITLECNGQLFAIRRKEASMIEVKV
ncbi:FeoA family protein [Paenibacillus sp. MMS20-IR301]|uniref:FeoA family protein n=1 Tax=Paenibacillus sp. MMS20-IR301 TaxID=2895946 RepID=UPI0028E8ECB3|nr:FeoA family protein [Paenibacillus sp. MMS20-IR301]WNS40901.1 FeoA family protein [Paenibacillus sp. MMS20-IR301]